MCLICEVAVCHFKQGTEYDCHKKHEQKHMHRGWLDDMPEWETLINWKKYVVQWGTVKACR
jgi:hypothetical protein